MKDERSQDLEISKNRILGGEKEGRSKRKIIRRGQQGVGAEGCREEIREIELSEGERRGKDQDRGEERGDRKGRALGPKAPGTCPHRPDVCFAT